MSHITSLERCDSDLNDLQQHAPFGFLELKHQKLL